MTFAELARIRDISKLSAVALVRRHGWRRQRDNQGHVIALVPLSWASHEANDQSDSRPSGRADDQSHSATVETVLAALREVHAGEIGRLTEALAVERSRVDALMVSHRGEIVVIEAKLAAAEARAAEVEQLRAAIEAEHTHGADLEARIAGLHGLLADAEHRLVDAERGRTTALEQLDAMDRAETERRGKGRWARLRAAWRGQ
jgi:hypothetical protein